MSLLSAKRAALYLLFMLCIAQESAAKMLPAAERIRAAMRNINKWGYGYEGADEGRYDSLTITNDYVIAELMAIASRNAALMNADLKTFDTTGLHMLTSKDGRLRVFSWDAQDGGTMHYYNNVAAYRSGTGIRTVRWNDTTEQEGGDPGAYYTDLVTMDLKDGTSVYLAFYAGHFSNRDLSSGLKAYSIRDGNLEPMPFFQTLKNRLTEISYSYNFFSLNDGDNGEPHTLHLSKDHLKLYVPVVIGNDSVSDRFLMYRFDGSCFVFDKALKP